VEDIKKKKGGHIHVKTDSNKVVIFAIPKTNAAPTTPSLSSSFSTSACTVGV
jgi:hypothetical protein